MDGEAGISACAVLPAGGSGERFGTLTPKQFCTILGRPLVSYTLEAFERVKWIEHIVLVVSRDSRPEVEEILKTYGHIRVSLAEGCKTRHGSIYSGIQALEKGGFHPEVVIIHDAVRPFVDAVILHNMAVAAHQHGAAGAIRPLVSTIVKTTPEGILDVSLDRALYRASEMPQAFRYHVINTAYKQCTDYDFEFGTECLHLAQKYGGATVKLIEGEPNLWKVTHKKDIYAAEGMIKEQYNKVVVTSSLLNKELHNALSTAMEGHCLQLHSAPNGTLPDDTHYIACIHPIQHDIEPDDLERTVLDLTKGRHPTMTSGVILVLLLTQEEDSKLTRLKVVVQRMAHDKIPHGTYLNLVIVPSPHMSSYLRPLPDLTAELAFQRNLILSGQTFYARLQ